MKILSVRQPWAWLIVNALKDVENRGRICNHRGELYIHASKTYDDTANFERIKRMINDPTAYEKFLDAPMQENGILLGGIVGKVQMISCVTESDSPWFEGQYGYVFKKPEVIPFRALRGFPGIFEINSAGTLNEPYLFFSHLRKHHAKT